MTKELINRIENKTFFTFICKGANAAGKYTEFKNTFGTTIKIYFNKESNDKFLISYCDGFIRSNSGKQLIKELQEF